MNPVSRDVSYGARLLWKDRGFTVVALVTLGLGLGVTTAIFSVVDAVLLKPLPFRKPDQLLVVWEKNPAQHKFKLFVSGANYRDWQQQSQTIESMGALMKGKLVLTGGPDGRMDPEEIQVERVTASMLPTLGVQPVVGRAFLPEEDRPGHNEFALLSNHLWRRKFAADPNISGKTILLGGRTFTVVGVLPDDFAVLDPTTDLWTALGMSPGGVREGRSLTVIARMKPGLTFEQVRNELEVIGNSLEKSNPSLNGGWRPSPFPFRDELVGNVRKPLLVLLAAVGFLLAMACANVANLLLTRGATRRKEFAVRAALGATRGRVIVQLLSESLLLSLAGAVGGLLLARAAMAVLARTAPESIPHLERVQLDVRLFLFALAAAVLSGALFGVAPALQVSGGNLGVALNETSRGGTSSRGARLLRNALVVVEIALAVVVLIGAGLLLRSFERLRAADPGFRASGLLTCRLSLAGGRNAAVDRRIHFFQDMVDRVASLPGVQSVGAVSSLPLTGLWEGVQFSVACRPTPPPDQRPTALVRSATAGYFPTMGIPLLAGRNFETGDTHAVGNVVIVNQALVKRCWPQGDPIGQHLVLANGSMVEIVGVVGDVKQDKVDGEDWPMVYGPYAQLPFATMMMALRTAGPPRSVATALERVVHQVDPDQPLTAVKEMENLVEGSVAGARFNAIVLGVFAVIAFVLAAVGIYGVIARDVSDRTHELGIRLALGAGPKDVLQLVLGQGARLAALGIAIGLAAAFALTRLMTTMLYGVKASDAFTFVTIPLLLAGVAMAASYLPSRRATALDPVVALRHE